MTSRKKFTPFTFASDHRPRIESASNALARPLFIFALQYDVAVEGTTAATLVSTVLSLLTLSVLLFLLL